MKRILLMAASLLALSTTTMAQTSVMDVSRAYLEADASMDVTRMAPFYADSVRFEDPTGDVFQSPTGGMAVTGRDTLLALQASWGLAPSRFEVERSFSVGRFAVHNGTYHVYSPGQSEPAHIPFVTVHEVVDGLIASRMDFGEYIESFGLGDAFDATTEETRAIAEQYMRAYTGKDFDAQAALLAGNARFHDPTATALGPEWGHPQVGAETIMARRRATHPALETFSFETTSSFVANHHAVYVGTVAYTMASGPSYRQPAVFAFEVRDGHVVRHWDFVDYSVGPIQK